DVDLADLGPPEDLEVHQPLPEQVEREGQAQPLEKRRHGRGCALPHRHAGLIDGVVASGLGEAPERPPEDLPRQYDHRRPDHLEGCRSEAATPACGAILPTSCTPGRADSFSTTAADPAAAVVS